MAHYKNTFERPNARRTGWHALSLFFFALLSSAACFPVVGQNSGSSELSPRQREIEKYRRRLGSADGEERRDAVMRLGSMKHPDSSRVAASALNDPSAIVRATAASAVLSIPAEEAVAVLVPLLKDKNEFVRQNAAYALGATHSPSASHALIAVLVGDKQAGVRGAAAVSLGLIRAETASSHLARILDAGFPVADNPTLKRAKKREDNEFVQRSAARALGQIRSRAAVPALIIAIGDKRMSDDVRREAVIALGLIGDVAAVTILRETLAARDPHLASSAYEALLKLSPKDVTVRP